MKFNLKNMDKITRVVGLAGLQLKKAAPTLMVIGGSVGSVCAIVRACKDTPKAQDILEEHRKALEVMKEAKALNDPRYDEKAYRKEVFDRYIKTGLGLLRVYAPTIIMEVASVSLFFMSHYEMKKRNMALASAYTLLDQNFSDYKEKMKDILGADTEKAIRIGGSDDIQKIGISDENGEEKVTDLTEEEKKDPGHIAYSPYARFFDDGCTGWTKDSSVNNMILRNLQAQANNQLQRRGYVFLNEIYSALGIPATKASYQVGWYYNPKNPKCHNVIDFGLDDPSKEKTRDFVNGYERTVLLDFNVDGNLFELMPDKPGVWS